MGIGMIRFACFVGIIVAACVAASSAQAFDPRFISIEKITLPDGQTGEMRLLKGDAIFFANWLRVLVLDEKGHAIARSPRSHQMTFFCAGERNCLVVDLENYRTFELDPATFRSDLVVPEDRDQLAGLGAGEEIWGFRVRHASLRELLSANFSLTKRLGVMLLFPFAWGLITSLVFFGWRWRPQPRGSRFSGVVDAVVTALRLVGFVFVLCIGLFLLEAVGAAGDIWLVFLLAGAGLVPLVKWLNHQRRAGIASLSTEAKRGGMA
jgi:hypothetical protein